MVNRKGLPGRKYPITQATIFKLLPTPCFQGATRATQRIWGAFIPLGHIQVAEASGCLPFLQALKVQAREHFLVFPCLVSTAILILYLQLNCSSSPVEQGFHQSWAPPDSSHLVWRKVHKHFIQQHLQPPPALGGSCSLQALL